MMRFLWIGLYMDWMIEDGYGKLKEMAQHREEWSRRTFGPAYDKDAFNRAVQRSFTVISPKKIRYKISEIGHSAGNLVFNK